MTPPVTMRVGCLGGPVCYIQEHPANFGGDLMWEPQFANLARRVAAIRVALPFRHASPRLER